MELPGGWWSEFTTAALNNLSAPCLETGTTKLPEKRPANGIPKLQM
jgi:hypothetical protein